MTNFAQNIEENNNKEIVSVCNYAYFKVTYYRNIIVVEPNINYTVPEFNNSLIFEYNGLIVVNVTTKKYNFDLDLYGYFFKEYEQIIENTTWIASNRSLVRYISYSLENHTQWRRFLVFKQFLRKYGIEVDEPTFLIIGDKGVIIRVLSNSTTNQLYLHAITSTIVDAIKKLGYDLPSNATIVFYKLTISPSLNREFQEKILKLSSEELNKLSLNSKYCIFRKHCASLMLSRIFKFSIGISYSVAKDFCNESLTQMLNDTLNRLKYELNFTNIKGFPVIIEPGRVPTRPIKIHMPEIRPVCKKIVVEKPAEEQISSQTTPQTRINEYDNYALIVVTVGLISIYILYRLYKRLLGKHK